MNEESQENMFKRLTEKDEREMKNWGAMAREGYLREYQPHNPGIIFTLPAHINVGMACTHNNPAYTNLIDAITDFAESLGGMATGDLILEGTPDG